MHFSIRMYKESLHNCIVDSVLTCLAGDDCVHALTPSGSSSLLSKLEEGSKFKADHVIQRLRKQFP